MLDRTTYEEVLERARLLSPEDQARLLEELITDLRQRLENQQYHSIMAEKYRNLLLKMRSLSLVSLTQSIAEEAARLRAIYKLHTADAIQMATALNSRAPFFLTNDKRLTAVSGLEVLILDELKAQSDLDKLKTDS